MSSRIDLRLFTNQTNLSTLGDRDRPDAVFATSKRLIGSTENTDVRVEVNEKSLASRYQSIIVGPSYKASDPSYTASGPSAAVGGPS